MGSLIITIDLGFACKKLYIYSRVGAIIIKWANGEKDSTKNDPFVDILIFS